MHLYLQCLHTIVGLVGLVPLCHSTFVGISWVQIFFSLVFRGSRIFSRGSKNVFVGILWVQKNFSRVFCEFKLWFFWLFCGSNIFFVADFVIQGFSAVGCLSKSDWKQKYINTFQTMILIQTDFSNCQFLLF